MGKFLLLLGVLVIYATYLVHSEEEELYPNWQCHPGYDSSTESDEKGEGWVRWIMNKCKTEMDQFATYAPERICLKSCILQWHYITVWYGNGEYDSKLKAENEIAERLNYTFPDNTESRDKIAKSIHADCADLGSKLPVTTTCEERADFFACLEKAWSCSEEESTEKPAET
ncbi:hypothetical protein Ocin01_15935 [Orchesella cincta]|uniref:Uncharacterized protein n=1 Tax=Orchesella cincta TaxID=48709 RepID=A0A1D2MCM2_ORCCI|nr:hypothetical protein Ocin01_15935 [Orchesella cincta]